MRLRPLALLIAAAVVAPAAAAPKTNEGGIDLANFDKSTAACTDFYAYANGTWLKNNPVPAAYSSWGTFSELDKRNSDRLKAIAIEAAARTDAAPGSVEAQVGAFYAAAIDEAAIERRGIQPIAGELAAIDAIESPKDVVARVVAMQRGADSVLFGLGVRQDLKDNTRIIAYATQGGLGLPNRDFYLRDDEASKKQLAQYREHVAKMLELSGVKAEQAAADAAAILALETRFAKVFLPREDMRDPNKSYNVIAVAKADEATPNFSWSGFFTALGLEGMQDFSFSHPAFFAEMDKALGDVPVGTWKAYLRWNVLRDTAPYLSKALVDENFRFYGQVLRGQKEMKPREERAIDQMNSLLGEPLGQLFVARHFPPEAKARMMVMIGDLKVALRKRLEGLEWMSEDTRKQAIEKWATFTPKIGYPDKWRDYSAVEIKRDDFAGNVRRLAAFEQAFDLAKIGKPIDRSEWGMPPQQVNAYYNAVWNEIVFPAGILQPPFFDMDADDALNYGAIGGVIGHELMHGFDDSGSRFDAQGRLQMWWTTDDRRAFDARAQKLVDQAGEFTAIGDMRLNGRVSLGENIADLGGLKVAYDALQARLAADPQDRIDGFAPEQRFYLGWAQVWRRNWTDEALKLQVNTGPHAPGKFRVNGPLSNLATFKAAFACDDGDPMVRPQPTRVAIW
jgi:putative endopeptidase